MYVMAADMRCMRAPIRVASPSKRRPCKGKRGQTEPLPVMAGPALGALACVCRLNAAGHGRREEIWRYATSHGKGKRHQRPVLFRLISLAQRLK